MQTKREEELLEENDDLYLALNLRLCAACWRKDEALQDEICDRLDDLVKIVDYLSLDKIIRDADLHIAECVAQWDQSYREKDA